MTHFSTDIIWSEIEKFYLLMFNMQYLFNEFLHGENKRNKFRMSILLNFWVLCKCENIM